MPAYVIGHIEVIDPDAWQRYRSAVPATLEPHRAELMFRARLAGVLGGEHAREQVVTIRFDDLAGARRWFDSPAYQALIPLREQAARVDLLLFEGE